MMAQFPGHNRPVAAASILLADFDRARPTEALGTTFAPGRWRLLPFRADGVEGQMIGAGEDSSAPEIAYPLARTGRHRISLGIFNGFWRPYREQRIEVRLSDEPDWTTLTLAPPSDLPWGIPLDDDEAGPRVTEVAWKVADLDGRDLPPAPAPDDALGEPGPGRVGFRGLHRLHPFGPDR